MKDEQKFAAKAAQSLDIEFRSTNKKKTKKEANKFIQNGSKKQNI